jgi:hypothetical protein
LTDWLSGGSAAVTSVEGAEAAAEDSPLASATEEPGQHASDETTVDSAGEAETRGVQLEPVEPAYPVAGDVTLNWASAWSQQRVDDYLGFYSSEFMPPNGASRKAWEAYRRERLEAPDSIEITITELTEEVLDADRTRVVFIQAYRAGSYSDVVRKTLVMTREEGTWRILSEQSEAL